MRILLVSPFFPPQNASASVRAHAFAKYWARWGEDVTVLTTRKREDQRGFAVSCAGFRVVEVAHRGFRLIGSLSRRQSDALPRPDGGPEPRDPQWLRSLRRLREQTGIYNAVRMPDLTDWWVRPALEWALAQEPWDVAVSTAGPYTAHLVALELKRRRMAFRWAADYRDLWTENHAFRGLFPFTVRERWLERVCHREVDLLTTVSPELARRLEWSAKKRAEVIFNGHDEELGASLSRKPAFPADGTIRLVYTGTLYPRWQDAGPLFEALEHLFAEDERYRRLRLVIAGPGREQWLRLARSSGVDGALEHVGIVSRVEALRLQRDAHALLLFDWRDPERGVLTTKLFEYLFASSPVLSIGGREGSPVARILAETGRGLSLGSSPETIAAVLRALVDEERAARPPCDRKAIRFYSRETQSRILLAHLRHLAASSDVGREEPRRSPAIP